MVKNVMDERAMVEEALRQLMYGTEPVCQHPCQSPCQKLTPTQQWCLEYITASNKLCAALEEFSEVNDRLKPDGWQLHQMAVNVISDVQIEIISHLPIHE
jgi:hypothetical protein